MTGLAGSPDAARQPSGSRLAGAQPEAGKGFAAALMRHASRLDDGVVLRWAFRGMLAGTIAVLTMDYLELYREAPADQQIVDPLQTAMPVLPPAVDGDEPAGGVDPRPFLKTDQAALRRPMQFTLGGGGTLMAEGSIEPGAAARLAAELQARGEYVKTVSLNSPGGALDDAMEMGRLVRSKGLATEVADGALCASSCPLFFAGGKKRLAGAKSAVGVHQFYAVATPDQRPAEPAQAMSDAQMTTARITRHLGEMGVDPAAWLHALDTPPRALYYFSVEEMSRYRLATGPAAPRPDPEEASGPAG